MVKHKQAPKATLYIGVMSGTSLDGIDVVLYDFNAHKLIATYFLKYPKQLRADIIRSYRTTSYAQIIQIEQQLNALYVKAIHTLLVQSAYAATAISAIGLHGQTVYHSPPIASLQLGQGAYIAYHTGIPTVNDFRARDIMVGGEGAPLTPKYHLYLLNYAKISDASIINIGGITNITTLQDNTLTGYDSGPGNTLIDAYVQQYFNLPYDTDGTIARNGNTIPHLLQDMLTDSYFSRAAPKSTGTEYFNMQWLKSYLQSDYAHEDIVSTLTELTAKTLCAHMYSATVYLCGGGVHNAYLVERIRTLLYNSNVDITDVLGAPTDYVEAIAFAYFAKLHMQGIPANIPNVTGATAKVVLGTLHYPH